MAHIRYRPDIDGLRALAVLPVVAFHIGIVGLSGGFIGVDIFFVISGYLIGRGIVEDLEAGRFSIAGFYERRFRRILPALIVMLAVTTLASSLLLFPSFLAEYGSSLVSAVASVSNVWFWSTIKYFGPTADTKPLLHTWSLAVEEQYYLLMPLVLMLAYRFARRRLAWIIGAIALVSLAVSAYLVITPSRGAAFYLLHARAWELMAGLLVHLTPLPALRRAWVREAAAWTALAVIAACVVSYHSMMPFPGFAALPPVAAGAALIAVGGHGGSSANRLLSWRPLVWAGLISYSLYLWHWPILVLYRFGLQQPGERPLDKLALLVAAIGAAWLSWRFVERPFRTTRHLGRGAIFALAGASAAVLIAAGAVLVASDGLPGRYPPRVRQILAVLNYDNHQAYRSGTCFAVDWSDVSFDLPTCLASPRVGAPNVLLYGDSQAAHLYYGFAATFTGSNIWQLTGAGCPPTFEDRRDASPRCAALHTALRQALATRRPDLIVLAGHWQASDLRDLDAFVAELKPQAARLLVVGPIPEYDSDLPALVAFDAAWHRHDGAKAHLRPDLAAIDAAVSDLARRRAVGHISLRRGMCAPAGWPCPTVDARGTPLYFDGEHLTAEGSLVAARAFVGVDPALRPGVAPRPWIASAAIAR